MEILSSTVVALKTGAAVAVMVRAESRSGVLMRHRTADGTSGNGGNAEARMRKSSPVAGQESRAAFGI